MSSRELKYLNNGDKLSFRSGITDKDKVWYVGDTNLIVITVVGSGTLAIIGSEQVEPPDFTTPSVIGNSYRGLVARNYSLSGAPAYSNGDTGVSVVAQTKIVEVDTRLVNWINLTNLVTFVTDFDILVTLADNT